MKPTLLLLVLASLLSSSGCAVAATAADDPLRFEHEVHVAAPRSAVWTALTTSEGLRGWIAPESNVELKLGGAWELFFTPDAADRGMEGTRVLSFVPEEVLSYTGEDPGTWVVWRLDDARGGTRVRLTALGVGEAWGRRFDHFRDATPGVLQRLADSVAPKQAAPPSEPSLLQDVIPKQFDNYLIAFLYTGENASRISAAQREQFAAAHLANLRKQVLAGKLLVAGPFQAGPEQPLRGIAIADGSTSPDELRALFAEDPFVTHRVMRLEIVPWMTSQGSIRWPETPVW